MLMSARHPASSFDESRLLDWVQRLPSFEEALARLLYVVELRRPCGLVLGLAGTGKSVLLDVLFRRLAAAHCHPLLVDLQTMGGAELPWALASGLGLSPTESMRDESLWRMIEDRLHGAALSGQSFVPIIDHLIPSDARAVAGLARCVHLVLQFGGTVVLSARPPLSTSLAEVVGPICDLRIEMPLWTRDEMRILVDCMLEESPHLRMDDDLPAVLQGLTGGRMRDVLQVLRLAMFAAEAEEIDTLDAALLQSVVDEIWRPADVIRARPASALPPTVQLATSDR